MNDQKIPATAAPSSLPVWEMLKAGHNMALYGLADGAANAYLHAHLQAHDTPHLALYTHKDLAEEQSPWLFPLTPGDIFSEWYLQESPAQNWGIQLATPLSLSELADHLMPFLTVQDEQGALHLMRFYDPRVINAYLTALTEQQRDDFFRPGLQLWADAPGQAETWLHYQQNKQQNKQQNNQQDRPQNKPPYRRTLIDLRTAKQGGEEEACAC